MVSELIELARLEGGQEMREIASLDAANCRSSFAPPRVRSLTFRSSF
ncbi:MAG TPA: hypothetical protein VGF85_13465 [Opitutaceae bacterium]|jgi:hypothetical protein